MNIGALALANFSKYLIKFCMACEVGMVNSLAVRHGRH